MAEIRTWKSENICRLRRFKSLALLSASLIAKASAIRAEQTCDLLEDPRQRIAPYSVFITHPMPPAFVVSCQSPSHQQDGDLSGLDPLGACCFCTCFFFLLAVSQALASPTALEMISSARKYFPSKINLFLAAHRFHNNHGTRGEETRPIGGREAFFTCASSQSLIWNSIDTPTSGPASGTFDQNSTTKGQEINKWPMVFGSPHLLQLSSESIPLVARREPTGRVY